MWKYQFSTFCYYFVFVTISFFLAPYLTSLGLSQETVGYLNILGIGLFGIGTFIFGYIADKKFDSKKIILINIILTITIYLLMIITTSTIAIAIMYLLIWFIFMPVAGFIDAFILSDTKDYAKLRSFGSLGAAISYFLNSYVLYNIAYKTIFLLDILVLVCMIFAIYWIENKAHTYQKIDYKKGIQAVINNKAILLIFVLTFLTYGTLSADDAFTYNFEVLEVGLTGTIIGITGFLSILLEFSIMRYYEALTKKLTSKQILVIVTIILILIFTIKSTLYTSKILIVLSDVSLGFFVGLFVPTIANRLNELSPQKIRNTIFAFYQATIKIGGVFLGLLTTLYYSYTQVYHTIYYFHLLILVIALIFVLWIGNIIFADKNKK